MNQQIAAVGYTQPTPIQREAIPEVLDGRDVIGLAQTGTGKTAAFALPILEKMSIKDRRTQALVLCPTRELAMQTAQVIRMLSSHMRGLRTIAVYGGQPIQRQIQALKGGAQVVVGTPGRLKDLIRRHVLKLQQVRCTVMDEADEMLDMGFREDMQEILDAVEGPHQTILFSATMPKGILDIAKSYQNNPHMIRIPMQRLDQLISQRYLQTQEAHKVQAVHGLLEAHHPRLALVFCNTRRKVQDVEDKLRAQGVSVAALHGDMRQRERDQIMGAFRKGKANVLVATDVAARGIDVDEIDLVINYDLPMKADHYVHRIGRTGRAGRDGIACTLVSPKERRRVQDMQRILHIRLKPEQLPAG